MEKNKGRYFLIVDLRGMAQRGIPEAAASSSYSWASEPLAGQIAEEESGTSRSKNNEFPCIWTANPCSNQDFSLI
jgi:hypothetical protein